MQLRQTTPKYQSIFVEARIDGEDGKGSEVPTAKTRYAIQVTLRGSNDALLASSASTATVHRLGRIIH